MVGDVTPSVAHLRIRASAPSFFASVSVSGVLGNSVALSIAVGLRRSRRVLIPQQFCMRPTVSLFSARIDSLCALGLAQEIELRRKNMLHFHDFSACRNTHANTYTNTHHDQQQHHDHNDTHHTTPHGERDKKRQDETRKEKTRQEKRRNEQMKEDRREKTREDERGEKRHVKMTEERQDKTR